MVRELSSLFFFAVVLFPFSGSPQLFGIFHSTSTVGFAITITTKAWRKLKSYVISNMPHDYMNWGTTPFFFFPWPFPGRMGMINPSEPVYCFCRQVAYGDMVGCDNPDCEHEWFHFNCVGLTRYTYYADSIYVLTCFIAVAHRSSHNAVESCACMYRHIYSFLWYKAVNVCDPYLRTFLPLPPSFHSALFGSPFYFFIF